MTADEARKISLSKIDDRIIHIDGQIRLGAEMGLTQIRTFVPSNLGGAVTRYYQDRGFQVCANYSSDGEAEINIIWR